jgi:hypothetical protein
VSLNNAVKAKDNYTEPGAVCLNASGFRITDRKEGHYILFTCGKDRFYEDLRQEAPNFNKTPGGRRGFKYCFRDLECRVCAEYESCPPICLCPHILDNLPDLRGDRDFIVAVTSAETCRTPQRLTLLYLLEGKICV